ncbi:micrococcal nuclease [Georgenia soli]|uniref:Micrococcal nuclease n=1 Tax=Georgenia soli TaxID=638953 RepID=A0A2A9ESU3_9MICO|nr:excalibur calcium-binding domain-containing protein [Georgenia soli]PFG41249.1 micrococcal nuclease [Georgenia soli]
MSLTRFVLSHKLAAAAITTGIVGGVVVGATSLVSASPETAATVTAIVDGDTLDVDYDGATHRVRLLNVDAAEADQCLGQDATDFLAETLPIGSDVILRFDEEKLDRYDRELAGVFSGDTLVNAEVARAGYGVAVLFEPNERFYEDVLEAQEEAETAGLGVFSAAEDCTLPGQLAAYTQSVQEVDGYAAATGATVEEYDGYLAKAAAAAAAGKAVASVLDGDRTVFPLLPYTGERWSGLAKQHREAATTLENATATIEKNRAAEVERLAAEERARQEAERRAEEERKAREEAERVAREEAERQAREEADRLAREEADRQAREQAERAAAQPAAPAQGGGSAYYKNCSAARAAGAAPVFAGEPGYGRHLDRDGDGVGCE